jgi:hypothetical protein
MKIRLDPADRAFSRWVRLRDRRCLRCLSPVKFNDNGLPVSHQASHFQGRGKENTRFDEWNVVTLCPGCHQYFHAYPAEHYLWQVERLGQAKVDEIILKSNIYCKRDRKFQLVFWVKELKERTYEQRHN